MNPDYNMIFIAGMHRSGTSAMARLVNILGAYLGKDLLDLMKGVNDGGFWENRSVVEFNERLLTVLGVSWYSLERIELDTLPKNQLEALQKEACSLIEKEYQGNRFIAIKDPRISRLLPFWLEIASLLKYRASVVHIIRDPLEVAQSLHKRDGFPTEYGVALWLVYNIDVIKATKFCSVMPVLYSELLENWRDVVQHMKICGVIPDVTVNESAANQIDAEVSVKYRHHITRPVSRKNEMETSALDIYNALTTKASYDQLDVGKGMRLIEKNQQPPFSALLESVINALVNRGLQLTNTGEELAYAQKLVATRDSDLVIRNNELSKTVLEKEHAESIVNLRDEQLRRIKSNPVLRLIIKLFFSDSNDAKS